MHRASIRSTVAQHINTKDEIFDKYLEEPDDGLEPRKPMDEDVEMLVDLTATREDHEEVCSMQSPRRSSISNFVHRSLDWQRKGCHYASRKAEGRLTAHSSL